jgi:hypothetical protein
MLLNKRLFVTSANKNPLFLFYLPTLTLFSHIITYARILFYLFTTPVAPEYLSSTPSAA